MQNLIQSFVCGSGKETVKPIKSCGSGRDPEMTPKYDLVFWLGIRKKRKNSIYLLDNDPEENAKSDYGISRSGSERDCTV